MVPWDDKRYVLWFKMSGHTGTGLERALKELSNTQNFSLFPDRIHSTERGWRQCWEELDCIKKKGVAIDTLHVKFHKVRTRKLLPQTPTCALQHAGTPLRHGGTWCNLCRFAGMSPVLQKSGRNEYSPSKHCWRRWVVIVSPVVLLCLSASMECAQKCIRRPAFKSFFCRRWFKHI